MRSMDLRQVEIFYYVAKFRSIYIIRRKGHTLSPLCQTFEHFLHSIDPVSLLSQDTPSDAHQYPVS
jgi:hypothetical protein